VSEKSAALARGKNPVKGKILMETVIPATKYGAYDMTPGQVIRVIDVEGSQVPDVLVYDRHNLKEQLSMRYSLLLNGKMHLSTGDLLCGLDCVPMMTIVGDTVGKHFWGGAFCSLELRTRYAKILKKDVKGMDLHGCRDNIGKAMEKYGMTKNDIRDGGVLNFFMNFADRGDFEGPSRIGKPFSKAGDYVEMRAERDVVVAISACPETLTECNDHNPTSVGVVIYQPN
jgi:uncharacterized protein YcgI (DUF1989 family)